MENYREFRNKDQYKLPPQLSSPEVSQRVQDDSSPMTSKIAEQQQKALIPLKEDLADWISKLTGNILEFSNFNEY